MPMTRKQRLEATLQGAPVDRPAVNFYEISGLENRRAADPHNIYSDSSWHPLLDLAAEKTDRMAMCDVHFEKAHPDPIDELSTWKSREENGNRFSRLEVRAGNRVLTKLDRRDRDINTTWHIEHLIKDIEDLDAYLDIPPDTADCEPVVAQVLETEEKIGDSGIALISVGDPLCTAAELFDMATFTIVAMTEREKFRRLLDRFAGPYVARMEAASRALPGRLWRICGPEYATPPYLPPDLFEEYVVRYDTPMVEAIHKHGGFARIHCHGRIKAVLDMIAATGCDGLDPIEPAPQGDVELRWVREQVGDRMALFGNIEASDIENLPTRLFEKKIETALREGTMGGGRGFVLMPSACPYGRKLAPLAMRNYERMVEMTEAMG